MRLTTLSAPEGIAARGAALRVGLVVVAAALCSPVIAAPVEGEARCFAYRKEKGAVLTDTAWLRETVESCNRAIAAKPDSDPLYGIRGELHLRLDQYDAAIADFDKTLSLMGWMDVPVKGFREMKDELTAFTLLYRGCAYGNKNDHAAAIRDFTEALALEPKLDIRLSLLYWRGTAYELSKDRERAAADYRTLLALQPHEAIEKRLQALEKGKP